MGYFLGNMREAVNFLFIGYLDNSHMLAGVGMGTCIINITGMAFIIGMNMAQDTLISQSMGQGNLELCGVYLNRSRFIITCLFIPVIAIVFNIEAVLVFLK
jgi:Na+-driven multidrug efflux pump